MVRYKCIKEWHSSYKIDVDYGVFGEIYELQESDEIYELQAPFRYLKLIGLGEDTLFRLFGCRAWLNGERFELISEE